MTYDQAKKEWVETRAYYLAEARRKLGLQVNDYDTYLDAESEWDRAYQYSPQIWQDEGLLKTLEIANQ